ncbi:Chloroperoxidase [Flagelloscypha sp. PMI_526]|nr:Chloroperoxidase [Flagelloscypha sp. PMI_526]
MVPHLSTVILSLCLVASATSYSGGRLIEPPPKPDYTGIKELPDKQHPFKAPGPDDLRGPCPALNVLANHGYLPRGGIATFEELVTAAMESFNFDYATSSTLSAFGMLSRGNAFTNQLSIGGPTQRIPPLPGNIDGNYTRGLSAHGRFEGDVSMTRRDFGLGGNAALDPELFSQLLDYVALYGNDSDVTGPKSVVTEQAVQEFKYRRYLDSVTNDPVLAYHFGRLFLSYGEASIILYLFANGTDGILSTDTLKSFFQTERFPNNWYRRGTPVDFNMTVEGALNILSPHPDTAPGMNVNGTFIPDAAPTNPLCDFYEGLFIAGIPAVLVNTTGILKTNVEFLLETIHNVFPSCEIKQPTGTAGI